MTKYRNLNKMMDWLAGVYINSLNVIHLRAQYRIQL